MSRKIVILIIIVTILLTACGAKTTKGEVSQPGNTSSEATSAPQESNNETSSSDDVSGALNLVLGTTDKPGVFDSYHIELILDTPQTNDDDTAIVNEVVSISADVDGKNVHIFQIDPGMTEAKEGYVIGDNDTEFKLIDGVWEATMGQIAMGWVMWPLQVIMPYAYSAALYSNKIGTEDVNGRSANVYELDTSKADPATVAGMAAFGIKNMTSKGTVWIDKETGAMLKLDLEYTSDITSLDGSIELGPGGGHITLEISNVNNVTVTSPK